MARLPSSLYLMQQIDGDVVLYEEGTEEEIVRYPANDTSAIEKAQLTIHDSALSEEDKCFAHFWSGYFYAYSSGYFYAYS